MKFEQQPEVKLNEKQIKDLSKETGLPYDTVKNLEKLVSEGKLEKHGKYTYSLPGY